MEAQAVLLSGTMIMNQVQSWVGCINGCDNVRGYYLAIPHAYVPVQMGCETLQGSVTTLQASGMVQRVMRSLTCPEEFATTLPAS